MASGATCVRRFDGSRDSAIHTTYRISLRSSSMREPRYPLPGVVRRLVRSGRPRPRSSTPPARSEARRVRGRSPFGNPWRRPRPEVRRPAAPRPPARATRGEGGDFKRGVGVNRSRVGRARLRRRCDNDPSAGSPTETLLRLLLPLNDKVQWTSRVVAGGGPPASPRSEHFTGPFNR